MTFVPPRALPGWLPAATEWIRAELGKQGIRVTGAIEQPHVRHWSTVLRVPTTAGSVYFKACAPVLAREPELVQVIAAWQPDLFLPLYAVDMTRGWMLMPDGGERLRSVIQADRDLGHWRNLLPRYGQLQIDSAHRADALLAAGALDRRLANLPELYKDLISDAALLRLDLPDGITSAEHTQLRRLAPQVAEMCRTLAAYAVPEALDHSDFHDGNIFYRDGRYIIFDWGDACITHPFCSLNVVLVSIENTLGLEPHVAQVQELVDGYLEPWARFESRDNLRRALKLAGRVGMINRALTWHRVLSGADDNTRMEYAIAIPEWLREFIQSNEEQG